MRQVFVHVPRGQGDRVLRAADDLAALSAVRVEAERGTGGKEGNGGGEQAADLVIVSLSNARVGLFIEHIEETTEAPHITYLPQGALTFAPPPEEAPAQVADVEPRSPVEVFLAGHQSVGAWKGFLGYAAAAGVVVWVGLYTGTVFLLTAAMLIAPFAGPAMNTALATAAGDGSLLRRSLARYGAAILVSVAVAAVLGFVLRQQTVTALMAARSQVSSVAVLLPLVAGAAGALFLISSDRSSLVSGASVGVLVAASLAPPAGVLGMSVALGTWSLAKSVAFVLALQLVGINLSGALVFRFFGLGKGATRYTRSRSGRLFPIGLAVSAALLGGLLSWQLAAPAVTLERATLAQRAVGRINTLLEERPDAAAVDVTASFTRSEAGGRPILLAHVVARPTGTDHPQSLAVLEETLQADLARAIRREWPSVAPLVDLRMLNLVDESRASPSAK